MVKFGKINSKRMYSLELQNGLVHLMVEVKDDNQESSNVFCLSMNVFIRFYTEKLIVLPVDDEIKEVVSYLLKSFVETGFVESAAKCHKKLRGNYAISDGRIRLVRQFL